MASKAEKTTRKPAKEQQGLDTREPRFSGAALWELLGVDEDHAGWTKGLSCTALSPLEGEAHPGVQGWAWSLFSESKERSLCFKHETK